MKKAVFVSSLLLAFFCGPLLGTQAEECAVDDQARALSEKYETVKALTAVFTQKNFIASLNQFREFRGTISLERPHLFSMEVTTPSEQRLVFDGHYYWVYTVATNQVLKNRVPPDFAQHPLINLLSTMENLDRDFIVTPGITRSADEYSLTLTLRNPKSDLEGVHLTVGKIDFQIHELVLRYCSGNYTQFALSDIKENPYIPQERFQFEPPPGVEVVENPAPSVQTP